MANPLDQFIGSKPGKFEVKLPVLPKFEQHFRSSGFVAGVAAYDEAMEGWRRDVERILERILSSQEATTTTEEAQKGDRGVRGLKGDPGEPGARGPAGPASSGGVSSRQILSGTVDPTTAPAVSPAIYVRTDVGALWFWNGAAWVLLLAA